MIEVLVEKQQLGYEAIKVTNHADTNVCNIVSTIMWAMACAIKNFVPDQDIAKMITADGYFDIQIIARNRDEIDMIFLFVLIALKQLGMEFPGQLKINEKNTCIKPRREYYSD